MARVFLTHRVRDYAEWRQGYDADAERRSGAGFSEVGHYHSAHDPNEFLIVWDTELSMEETTAMVAGMLSDPDLGRLMEEAGVLEKPEFWVA
jgi:hypothetical protein